MSNVTPLIKRIVKNIKEHGKDKRLAKYFLFKIEHKTYAVAVENVAEIIDIPNILTLPKSNDMVSGVVNIRGNIIPVINIRKRLGLTQAIVSTDESRLLLLTNSDESYIGIVIDSISYRLKDGILEKTENESIKNVVINGEKCPVFTVSDWLNNTELKVLREIVDAF